MVITIISIIKIIITAEAKCYVLKRILFQYVIE